MLPDEKHRCDMKSLRHISLFRMERRPGWNWLRDDNDEVVAVMAVVVGIGRPTAACRLWLRSSLWLSGAEAAVL